MTHAIATRARIRRGFIAGSLLAGAPLGAQAGGGGALSAEMDRRADQLRPKVVAWRRDLHEHPELSNREVRTAKVVADHLRSLGIEVRTEVAKTGVVGVLRGGRPGPVVALRADMDALPVKEEVDLPFRSKVKSVYNGQEVSVMHACGHDNHVAILMGVAEMFAGMKAQLPGTVKFIFQPAEEGPPPGEEGGAPVMVREGVLENPKVDAVFGLHVFPFPVGEVHTRPEGLMASSDRLGITVRGTQTHGAMPWNGVDPIVVAAQIVLGLQTITSRQLDLTRSPAIITIGSLHGGVRNNIIPDSVTMLGTIRTFDEGMRTQIHERITRTVDLIARSAGATAETRIERATSVTYNDPKLTTRMLPTLRRIAGADQVKVATPTTTAEDFSAYQEKVPGLFVFLGVTPKGTDHTKAAPNHSPKFFADEAALVPGMRVMAGLAMDYLTAGK